MRFYNTATDVIATDIKPYYVKGFIDHYKAKDAETGKKIRIERQELKTEWTQERHIDIDDYRQELEGV